MLDQKTLLNIFEYRDGKLYWKNAVLPSFNGKEAGYNNGAGYKKVTIKNKQYYVHRIIYMMHYGILPKLIDHRDCNPKNNLVENLREATHSQNTINHKGKNKASSGIRNVSFNKQRNKYCVYLKVNQKSKFFGNFDDLELAELVAFEARRKYYGKFNSQEAI